MSQAPVASNEVFEPQLARHKKGRFWRFLGISSLLVIAAGAGAAVFTQQGREITRTVKDTAPVFMPFVGDKDLIFTNTGTDHVNVLLVGEDRNWTIKQVFNPRTQKYAPLQVIDTDTPPRSDTLIIASLDKNSRAIRMISLPRDARVRFRDLDGDRHKGKLNSVYASGGKDQQKRLDVLKRFLFTEMGIRIDKTAVIKLDGFTNIIDRVGGVYVNVDGALKRNRRTGKFYRDDINYTDNWGKWEVHLKPGKQTLNGEQAHGYVRFRYDYEGDPGRIRRQQQVMQALARSIMNQGFLTMPSLAEELRKQFKADMTDAELASAALFAKNMPGGMKISPLTTYGTYADNGDVILNKPENEKLFTAVFGSSFNPDNFLVRSPSTERDDIGHTNNDNPAALPILKEAGLIKADETAPAKNAILDAPVETSDKS